MSNTLFEFFPEFQEYNTLYRGIEKVWVADGTEEKPGTEGYLYVKLVNGTVQELGSLLSYETAKEIYEATGNTLTYADWIQMMLNSPENAVRSEVAKDEAEAFSTAAQTSADAAEEEKRQAALLKNEAVSAASQSVRSKDLADEKATAAAESADEASTYANEASDSASEAASSAALSKASADKIDEALQSTAVIKYQNSTNGSQPPQDGTWLDYPVPEPGYYTWTRVTLSWAGLSDLSFYFVSGYKDPIATTEEIDEQFPGQSPYDDYASQEQIFSLFQTS